MSMMLRRRMMMAKKSLTFWQTVQANVRAGLAPSLYPVGTQFPAVWNGNTYHLDVVDTGYTVWTSNNGTPVSHSALALMFHETLEGTKQTDAGESSAAHWGKTGDGVKTFADLSAEIYATYPEFNGVAFNWYNASGRALVAASDSTSVTTSGVNYLANDYELGTGSNNRTNRGNNEPYISNITQWLNADGAANSWYEPWHIGDEAPAYANVDGFLRNLDPDLVSVLIPCAESSENLSLAHHTLKVFRAFLSQINGDDTYHFAALTNPTNADRIKYDLGGTARAWLLNSRSASSIVNIYAILATGATNNSTYASSAYYHAPVFYIF